MSKRWLLAQEFCAGHNRQMAAQAAGVGVHTAGRHYDAFERVLAGHLRRSLKQGRTELPTAVESSLRIDPKKVRSPKQTQRLAARVCFEALSIRQRVQLIYQLAFSARVERLLRQKPARHFGLLGFIGEGADDYGRGRPCSPGPAERSKRRPF